MRRSAAALLTVILFAGCAAQPPSPSAALAAEVRVKLQQHFLNGVDVKARGGRLELTGHVAKPQQKQQASALALSVPGVAVVYNKVRVESVEQEQRQ